MSRIKRDWEYIWLNRFVTFIPSWTIRRIIYQNHGMIIGRDARVGLGTVVLFPDRISIGSRTVVNEYCVLDGRGGLRIEHDSSVSMYCKIITASHELHSSSFKYFTDGVYISSYVWLGVGSIILNGSVLEENSVVGAGAVVKGVVKRNAVMVGNPAKEIKKRKLDEKYKIGYKPFFR